MSRMRAALGVALVFALIGLVQAPVYAQAVNTGTVIGQVTDASGAAVPGATVTLTDVSTKISRSVTTNAEGRYVHTAVPPGVYDLTVTAKSFREAKVSNQTVVVGSQLTLNVQLQVGAATEVVEVTATTGAELQTLNATVSSTFTQKSIDALPAIGRDVSSFAVLQPNVTSDGSVAGVIYDQNTFQLDGGQNTNDMDGSMSIYTPSQGNDPSGVSANCGDCYGGVPSGVIPTPIDSIEEFKVGTVGQTADFNSSAGSQVSMVTRRGHDAWHGTAYEYYLNNIWNANSFDNNAAMVGIPAFHYTRFGGAVGGPIVPKKILGGKTYFFGMYEGFRWNNSETDILATPGPGMRQGLLDFAGTVYNLNPTATTYTGPNIGDLVTGTVYPSASTQAACAPGGVAASCDPRGLGISPTMQALWALMPQGNFKVAGAFAPCTSAAPYCDGVNVLGFIGNVTLPERTDFAVARIDHDFGDKEHFFSSYRFYRLTRAVDNQLESTTAGGGGIVSTANRPQIPWFFVTGLTSNITSNFTNDFRYSYLRNWWLWGDMGAPPQLPGLGAALEPGGDQGCLWFGTLAPYNVNNQCIRQRYWDGQDHMFRDDMTRLLGNHLLQWGGIYQHNYDQHSRNDNGTFTNEYPTYVLGGTIGSAPASESGIDMTGYYPTGLPAADDGAWARDYTNVLGILSLDQYIASRSVTTLNLNPPLTPVEDKVDIPYYNVYFTDSWKLRPTLTLTYGLAWTLEMPPYEQSGEQVVLVNQENQSLNIEDYLHTEKELALQGQIYNPEIGYSLVRNGNGGQNKYPYNPYYGQFSPRAALAWSPNYDSGFLGSVFGRGKTVVRGGFSMIYGRLNGVDLVLVPLLGYGLLQPVQCFGPTMTGTCAGPDLSTPANGFRIGPTATGWDGLVAPLAQPTTPPCTAQQLCQTLPQPAFPGINSLASGDVTTTDPNFRPDKSYEFDFTVQRQITAKIMVEAGYVGRIIRNEFMPTVLGAIPYMFTVGGQQFQKAYANLALQYCGGLAGLGGGNCGGSSANVAALSTLTAQPFFETALGGAKSTYCAPYAAINPGAPCTAAVAANEGVTGSTNLSTQNVWGLWADLDAGPFQAGDPTVFTGPTTLYNAGQITGQGVGVNTSVGYGNYNAFFLQERIADWHGLTLQSNFTYSKTLGTGAVVQATSAYTQDDPFDINRSYGLQPWDRKFVLNTFLVYTSPYYKSQQGVIGHVLGGWSLAPIFVTGSGNPLFLGTETGADFGQGNTLGSFDQAVYDPQGTGCMLSTSTSRHDNVPGSSNGVGTYTPYNLNLYTNPAGVVACFRDPILGYDNGHNGGYGTFLRGQPYWNVDMQITKSTRITERVSFEFQVIFANIFNHTQFYDPDMTLSFTPAWGALLAQENTNRQFQFGARVRF